MGFSLCSEEATSARPPTLPLGRVYSLPTYLPRCAEGCIGRCDAGTRGCPHGVHGGRTRFLATLAGHCAGHSLRSGMRPAPSKPEVDVRTSVHLKT